MENAIKRGDIFYVSKGSNGQTGSEQYPDRPALIVSNNANNASSGVVEIVYLTTQPKIDLPTHVILAIKSCHQSYISICVEDFYQTAHVVIVKKLLLKKFTTNIL